MTVPEWLSTTQVAGLLGVDTETVRKRAVAGQLGAVRPAGRRYWRYRTVTIARHMDESVAEVGRRLAAQKGGG